MKNNKEKLFKMMSYLDESFQIKENDEAIKYYTIFDLHGDYNNGKPLYFISDSKQDVLNNLNKYIVDRIEENNRFKYTYDDLEFDYYNGEKLDTLISDDFTIVTYNEKSFNHYFNIIKKQVDVPEQYN